MRKMWKVEQNTTSSEYYIARGVSNSRGRRKTRVVGPVIGQAGCPGWEPDCLNPAGTWVGVSVRMYNDPNSLGDGAKEGRGSKGRHAGTGEGISAHIHVVYAFRLLKMHEKALLCTCSSKQSRLPKKAA